MRVPLHPSPLPKHPSVRSALPHPHTEIQGPHMTLTTLALSLGSVSSRRLNCFQNTGTTHTTQGLGHWGGSKGRGKGEPKPTMFACDAAFLAHRVLMPFSKFSFQKQGNC